MKELADIKKVLYNYRSYNSKKFQILKQAIETINIEFIQTLALSGIRKIARYKIGPPENYPPANCPQKIAP